MHSSRNSSRQQYNKLKTIRSMSPSPPASPFPALRWGGSGAMSRGVRCTRHHPAYAPFLQGIFVHRPLIVHHHYGNRRVCLLAPAGILLLKDGAVCTSAFPRSGSLSSCPASRW
jgi:hypothetical protein